jgi:two-component sensor histidine kinase
MDKLLLLLPGPLPIWARYGLTTLIVLAFFAVEVGIWLSSGFTGLFALLPAVSLAGILFDRGSGFYASLLATALASWLFMPSPVAASWGTLPLVLFFLTALGLATIGEALRKAVEHFRDSERAKDLLLREMAHRTKNNLTMVCSLLRIQARASADEPAYGALMSAAARVQVMADVNDFLRESAHGRMVDMHAYLEELCHKLADALRGARPVAIRVEASTIELPAEKAVPIGIIVNELVTNSFKHAFPDNRAGVVNVSLSAKTGVVVLVEDNGAGCPDEMQQGLGTRLMQLMTQQLHAQLVRESENGGCRVKLTVGS